MLPCATAVYDSNSGECFIYDGAVEDIVNAAGKTVTGLMPASNVVVYERHCVDGIFLCFETIARDIIEDISKICIQKTWQKRLNVTTM